MASFYEIMDVVDSLCLRSGDILKRNKGLYLSVAKEVWNDMNEDVFKKAKKVQVPVRQIYIVNKATNSVTIPDNLKVCSVHSVDRYGYFHTLYVNASIPTDIVDLSGVSNCACQYNCSNQLCNTIHGYEAVQSVKSDFLPNGNPISFNCVDKQVVDNQGFLYKQSQYPQRVYLSGVWTDTILYTENAKLCQVDVDTNGCVCDTAQNVATICNACGIPASTFSNIFQPVYTPSNYCTPPLSPNNCPPYGINNPVIGGDPYNPPCGTNADTWMYEHGSAMQWYSIQCGCYPYGFCNSGFNNNYNISQQGNMLIFPYNFGYDKVMIRCYEDIDLRNIQVPYLAKNCFMTGLQYYASNQNDKKLKLAEVYGQKFAKEKWGLFLELNKNTIAENAAIYTPKVFVPSYIKNHKNNWW